MLIWLLVLADFAAGADVDVDAEAEGAPTEGLLFRLTAAVVVAESVGAGIGVDSIVVALATRRYSGRLMSSWKRREGRMR